MLSNASTIKMIKRGRIVMLMAWCFGLLLGAASSFQAKLPSKVSFLTVAQSQPPQQSITHRMAANKRDDQDTNDPPSIFSVLSAPFKEVADMMENFDDVVDDFFYKRMGNGETFYGKRKYKPSGNVEGDYKGFGLTDKVRIDQTREYREAWLEERERNQNEDLHP
mmetsp:Transcript_6864/g.9998  ORF Transcript_6864/g.9998 Transcript_6864/m.9998 type:complete len:165 (-) Transcript_6864:65-559(-)